LTHDEQNQPVDRGSGPDESVPLNPYAAPIDSNREVIDRLVDERAEGIDLAKINRQAKWYLSTGILLAFFMIALLMTGLIALIPVSAILQFAWTYPALRHSSKYAKYLQTELRVGLRLALVFHCFILALATIVAILFVTCLAIFATPAN
jgi:hypothetical protein